MKKRVIAVLLMFLAVPVSSACFKAFAESGLRQQLNEIQQRSKVRYRIVFYGRDTSAACSALREKLDEGGIFYVYRDISRNSDARTEMWNLIREKDPGVRETDLPVLKVNNILMTAPSFEAVSAAVNPEGESAVKADVPSETSCEVVLYGRDSCSRCVSMKAKLDESGIPYSYRNLDENGVSPQMWKTVREEKPGTKKVLLPVMTVNGILLLNPEFPEVWKALKSGKQR